ncbi:MAG: DivIVA domain-containing protein [Actinomyces succiniciruminis]|uniref:Cell wall synthesis protein Wag31 n=1 Tax=Actinomyces succiniciruminis TaxID=1522002 RepID=A0A1L7RB03_9ACTO|nr:DivIVA domain-containing protein [Actinomyces succiniciruminis]CED91031.1 DivIVA protein [Actinomyces succiniciruminis]
MPLTADDVLNKKLPTTRFREGYGQEAVDEFLDEVIAAMRSLENELASAKARVARLERANARLRGQGGVTPGA